MIAAAVFSVLLLYVSMGQMLFENLPIPNIFNVNTHPVNYAILQLVLTVPILFIGRKFFTVGFKALYHLNPTMDSLVAIGSGCSFIYSLVLTFLISDDPSHAHHLYYESAGIVITLVMLGKRLEAMSRQKTTDAIKKLTELAPDTAILVLDDGRLKQIETDKLKVGDIVLVRPGDRIPADGTVIKGEGGVDESMLTGESLPVDKTVDSEVTGGSVSHGAFNIRITRTGDDTTLSRIIKFVEDAQGKKAPIASIADKVAGIFVPTVMGIAIVAAAAWAIAGKDLSFVLNIFTAVLVIACPCALGLATPTAIIVGTGLGAQNGILIRSGEALEAAHKAKVAVLDKTGTVTLGRPEVISAAGTDDIISAAAAIESSSAHPLAKAVTEYATNNGFKADMEVSAFTNLSGRGVTANIGEDRYAIGNERLMNEEGADISEYRDRAYDLAAKGSSLLFISKNGVLKGFIAIADTIRHNAKDAISALKKEGMRVVLLSGDNKAATDYVAMKTGADEAISNVLPEGKAAVVEELKKKYGSVIMVGDGINDAPALTQADVGCAVASGSDIAIESADIVLMKDDISDIPKAVKLSRYTITDIKQNLFWAFIYNVICIPVAAGVLHLFGGPLLSPMLGGLAMSLSSVCVVLNALRLKLKKL